jgi:hypothetical protein
MFFEAVANIDQIIEANATIGKTLTASALKQFATQLPHPSLITESTIMYQKHLLLWHGWMFDLYDKFIRDEAKYELNLPSSLRAKFKYAIDNKRIDLVVVEEVLNEALAMIYENSYKEYLAFRSNTIKKKRTSLREQITQNDFEFLVNPLFQPSNTDLLMYQETDPETHRLSLNSTALAILSQNRDSTASEPENEFISTLRRQVSCRSAKQLHPITETETQHHKQPNDHIHHTDPDDNDIYFFPLENDEITLKSI